MANSDVEHIWKLIESISLCMLTTLTGTKLRSRPMSAFARPEEGIIYFLTDARAHKDDEIRKFPKVCLAFADPRGQKYVSISGSAVISSDRKKIEELWSIPAKVWWESPDDPSIRIIAVTPEDAEYWDSPGNLASNIKVAFGMATGRHLDPGDHKKVAI
jgi:general stress protein 26